MKKCPYCGSFLCDNDRYCLYCMKPFSRPKALTRYGKQGLLFKRVLVLLALFLAIGTVCFICVYCHSFSSGNFPSLISVESNVSVVLPVHAGEGDKTQPSGNNSSGSNQDKNQVFSGVSETESANHPQQEENIIEQKEEEVSYIEASEADSFLSPEEFFKKMALLEEKELKTQLPGAVRTEKDLGPYSERMVIEGTFDEITPEDFDAIYQEIPEYRMNLAETVLETFQGDFNLGYGTSGEYHWELLQAKINTNDVGRRSYFFQVRIQVQIEDPSVTAYGVDTLAVVQQVRSHLSRNGQRVNALPQCCKGNLIGATIDEQGTVPNNATNQEKIIQELCRQLDDIISEYGYTRYRFDFRLAFPPSRGFIFAYYIEPM